MSVNLSKPEHINSDMRDQSRTSDKKRVGRTYVQTREYLHVDTRIILRNAIAEVLVEAFERNDTLSPHTVGLLRKLSQASENVLELSTIEDKVD